MALRDQPYLPLYVQDYLTDEKLSMCSWATQGIYIKILCLLHKSEPYGMILLKQNDKQNKYFASDFAVKIARLLPIDFDVLSNAISELVQEDVLKIDGNKLFQKRMVRDNEISVMRAGIGSKGGKKTQKLAKAKNKANNEANNEYENEVVNENKDIIYSKFYDNEILLSKNDEAYLRFVSFLFGDNDLNRPLNKLLNMNDQIKYSQFLKLRELSEKTGNKILDTIRNLENYTKKNYSSFYLTLSKWLAKEYVR